MRSIIQYIKILFKRFPWVGYGGDAPGYVFGANPEVRKALESYQVTVNRYNNVDLSDPRLENVYFLERQLAYAGLQVALAKARILGGDNPALDYTCFESLCKWMGQCSG